MQIGYIGLGNMGSPLARRLLLKNDVLVYDRSPAAVERMVQHGAEAAASAADLVARCDTVFLCLPTTSYVQDVLFDDEDGVAKAARPGTMFVDQTSGDPIATRKIVPQLKALGLDIIDAPVSGGIEAAEAGTIAILVGGTEAQFGLIEPVLHAISPNTFHAGPFGTGYVAKLANNLLFAAQRMMTLEVVAMAAKNGLEPRRAVEILMAGSSRNFFLEHTMEPRILSGRLESGFTLGLSFKDVSLATGLGTSSGVPMTLGNVVHDLYSQCIEEFGYDAQVNTAALFVDRISGTHVVPQAKE